MIEVYEIIFKSYFLHVDEKWFLGGQNIENSIFSKISKKLKANYYINFDMHSAAEVILPEKNDPQKRTMQ